MTGHLLLSEYRDPATGRLRVHIDQADPRALVDGDLMRQIAGDQCEPWASVSNDDPLAIAFADDHGQRFIYRVRAYDASRDVYTIEWPD